MIARLAHARGMRVSGHVPAFMTATSSSCARGADEIQHANFLMLNFLFDDVKGHPDAGALHGRGRARRRGSPRPQDRVRAFLALLKEKGTVIDPTLVAFAGRCSSKKGRDLCRRTPRSPIGCRRSAAEPLRQPRSPRERKALPGFLSVDAPE